MKKQLKLHEGYEKKPYKCTANKLTIGVGRNLEDKGLTDDEVDYLLENDIKECMDDLKQFEWYNKLSVNRKHALIDMRLNLGLGGLLSFKRMIGKIEENNFKEASFEMLDSLWANQVGERAERLAFMMKNNKKWSDY